MKTLQVSRSSWHYRFMRFMNADGRLADDLCTYVWSFMGHALAAVALASGLCMALAAFGFGLFCMGYLVAFLAGWTEILDEGRLVLGACFAFAFMILIGVGISVLAKHRGVTGPRIETPATVSDAWESLRGRMCFKLERVE